MLKVFWLLGVLPVLGCGARTPLASGDVGAGGVAGASLVEPQAGQAGSGGGAGQGGSAADAGQGGCAPDGSACQTADGCCSGSCSQGQCGEPLCPPGSPPVTLADGLVWPYGIAADQAFVYIPTYDDKKGMLAKVPKRGGSLVVMRDKLQSPNHVAVDEKAVYVAVTGSQEVLKFAKESAAVSTLASGQFSATDIALDATHAYWLKHLTGEVVYAPKAGGTALPLVSGQGQPFRIALGDTHVYYGSFDGLRSVPKPGIAGKATLLNQHKVRGVAADNSAIYWTTSKPPAVFRANLDGSSTTSLWQGNEGNSFPEAIALDATHIYWTDAHGGGIVRKIPKGGGASVVLAEGQDNANGLVVDEYCVYWARHKSSLADPPDGSVVKAPK